MKNLFFSFFVFITIGVTAQDSTKTEAIFGSIEKEEVKFLKNEFGLALNPLLTGLMGGSMYETRLALAYRRHLNEKWSLRMISGFHFVLYGQDDKFLYQEEEINYNSDSSSRTIFNTYYDLYAGYQLNSGLEFRWGKKKLKWFTGMDVSYVHGTSTNHTDKIIEELDTVHSNPYNFYTTLSTEETYRSERRANGIGLMPFIGIRAMFNKHWGFTTHFGFTGFISKNTTKYFYSGIQDQNIAEYTTYDFFSLALFQDVSLVFRF